MLAIFDVVVRAWAVDGALILSELLWDDGGYQLATALCVDNRKLTDVAATMELIDPRACRARARALHYFDALARQCRNELYDLRQPDKIEVRKYSSTVIFLRKMMARCKCARVSLSNLLSH